MKESIQKLFFDIYWDANVHLITYLVIWDGVQMSKVSRDAILEGAYFKEGKYVICPTINVDINVHNSNYIHFLHSHWCVGKLSTSIKSTHNNLQFLPLIVRCNVSKQTYITVIRTSSKQSFNAFWHVEMSFSLGMSFRVQISEGLNHVPKSGSNFSIRRFH